VSKDPLYAYIVHSDLAGERKEHIIVGPNLAAAAAEAHDRLQIHVGPGARLDRIEFLGEALGDGIMVPTAASAPRAPRKSQPRPARAAPAPKSGDEPTRTDQLVSLLEDNGGPVHLNEIADALGITRKNANSIVMRAGRAGLVRRVGDRSGRVELTK
jgi:hypothetical protein